MQEVIMFDLSVQIFMRVSKVAISYPYAHSCFHQAQNSSYRPIDRCCRAAKRVACVHGV